MRLHHIQHLEIGWFVQCLVGFCLLITGSEQPQKSGSQWLSTGCSAALLPTRIHLNMSQYQINTAPCKRETRFLELFAAKTHSVFLNLCLQWRAWSYSYETPAIHGQFHQHNAACRQVYRAFSWLAIDVEGPAHWGHCYPCAEGSWVE